MKSGVRSRNTVGRGALSLVFLGYYGCAVNLARSAPPAIDAGDPFSGAPDIQSVGPQVPPPPSSGCYGPSNCAECVAQSTSSDPCVWCVEAGTDRCKPRFLPDGGANHCSRYGLARVELAQCRGDSNQIHCRDDRLSVEEAICNNDPSSGLTRCGRGGDCCSIGSYSCPEIGTCYLLNESAAIHACGSSCIRCGLGGL